MESVGRDNAIKVHSLIDKVYHRTNLEMAWKKVKRNRGAGGIDKVSISSFEEVAEEELENLHQELRGGSYGPVPVRRVYIPKRGKPGEKRPLGIPTVADRVAQMVAKVYFEPTVEPYFHSDSYGYRPGKSAVDALTVTRQRCWKYDWVLEFDIKGLFDNIDHELLMKAVRKHTDNQWVILYIQRWLRAPFQMPDGTIIERTKGSPQGGVISSVLSNLFLHYAFDVWMDRRHQDKPFARYADDGVVHCRSLKAAEELLESLKERFAECGLEIHPDKTQIIYCKDDDRREDYPVTKFDFLGYTFRPRRSKSRYGKYFVNFTPAVSNKAKKHMQQTIQGWRMHLKPDKSLEDLSRMFNPVVRGWVNYYGHFYKSELYKVLRHMDRALVMWVRKKYKKNRHQRRATHWLGRIARREPKLFAHWQMGIYPPTG